MPRTGLISAILFCLLLPTPVFSADQVKELDEDRYTFREEHDPNGIGKFYLGREIAHVMGYLGANWLERPQREEEEKLSLLVRSLKLKPGMMVADIGAGSGVISLLVSEKIGPDGKVFAVDVQDEMLELLGKKIKEHQIENIIPVKGTSKSPNLEANSVDLIFMVDVYHEFSHPEQMLAAMPL